MARCIVMGLALSFVLIALPEMAQARINIGPYASIKSTKSINPNRSEGTETEKIKQRQEFGLRGSVSFWRLFKFSASAGQSKLTTTETTSTLKDEYDQFDYEEDLDVDTSDPDLEVKTTETQNVGKASLTFDPGFWIFYARFKAGVTARQRIIETEVDGVAGEKLTVGPTYNPHSGFGAGIKISRKAYFIAEYNFDHYKFPEIEPFEREVTVTFGLSL